ncbi:glucose-1-phosphate adenylyltransferase [Horticoccus luteus]|uniref:Glucose-1-phosphate adenylyltransferase n=1 Tax=Horticoccus luteus TaxID=2862869 RepID=A0A8F9XI86_9BACT|nr:glucose-1-phosphate adenylyltransferase [Horticoccus luteus]QYM80155.1 glucose-1-phosphate adenylyltransferase [Horticoccus luteus]
MTYHKRVLAVIMGGGRGTRLHPLTTERCKPAVPLAGKYRLVDIPISNCLNSEINRIFLLTQFQTASLHRHVQGTYHFDPFGGGFVDILAAEQTEKGADWYQGTADAVRRNLMHFRAFPHDLVLILSGDQLYRMDYREIIDQHVKSGADVTLAAVPFAVSKVEGLGLMRVNDALEIQEFAEKPKDPAIIRSLALSPSVEAQLKTPSDEPRCLASMGIYVFNRSALAKALDTTMADFGKEIIPGLLGKMKLSAFVFEGYWEDIGTVRAFFEANLALAQPLPPFNFFDASAPIYTQDRYLPASKLNRCEIDQVVIGDGSIITDSSLRHSILGIRTFIGDGTSLEDVIVMGADYYESPEQLAKNEEIGRPHLGVGRNCRIKHSIIDKNARIGDNCVISPEGKEDGSYLDGNIVIRDGVLVVPKGVTLASGTVF